MQFKFKDKTQMASKVFAYVNVIITVMIMFGGAALGRDVNVLDFKAIGDGVTNDLDAFKQAWAAVCASNDPSNNLLIPSQKTFLVGQISLQGPCKSQITVQVMGSIVAPKKQSAKWDTNKDWLSFSKVNDVTVRGTPSSSISGSASTADWWSCPKKPCDVEKPTALGFHNCNNCQVVGLNSRNPPKNHLSINNCNGFTVDNVNFQAPKESPNTDGIDISASKNVNIFNSFIGTGDDCIAINTGSSFINITSLNCGPGHGISVGSLGKNFSVGTASEIHVKNCTLNGTTNGARIKTFDGASGFATNITFEDITLINVGNPIIIDQHYCPNGQCGNPPKQGDAVEVSSVTFKGVHGTTFSKEAIDIECSQVKHCKHLVLDEINITPSKSTNKVEAKCSNVDDLSINNVVPTVTCTSTAAKGFISMPVVDQDATDEEDRSEL